MTEHELREKLAPLDPFHYEQQRSDLAKESGIRVGLLDELYAQEHPPSVPEREVACDVDPWPSEVDGDVLLEGMVTALGRFIAAPMEVLVTAAVWAVACFVFYVFNVFALLLVCAPTRTCGKSRLLDVLARLTPNPLPSGSASVAVLFRSAEGGPTMFLDELDRWLTKDPELIGFLNNGFVPNMPVRRCEGESHEVREFPCWCPKALAQIGRPNDDALVSRCLVLNMRRKLPSERIERFRHGRAYPELERLRRMAARWASDHVDELAAFQVDELEGLDGRELDSWEVLYAVASAAGGPWPDRIRAAVKASRHEDTDLVVELLADLRDVVTPLLPGKPGEGVFTSTLVDGLLALEDRPWATCRGREGKSMTGAWLARRLRNFEGLQPEQVRVGVVQKRGYRLDALKAVFDRYLPPPKEPDGEDTTPSAGPPSEASQTVTPSQTELYGHESAGEPDPCDDVTPCDGPTEGGQQDMAGADPSGDPWLDAGGDPY